MWAWCVALYMCMLYGTPLLITTPHVYLHTCVQESFHFPRSQPPHGSCFLGHPFVLHISPDQPKTEFDLECHSNENMLSVKQKIAKKLGVSTEQVQIGLSERWLDTSDNNKLIHQMGFSDHQLIIVKAHPAVSNYSSKVSEVGWRLSVHVCDLVLLFSFSCCAD